MSIPQKRKKLNIPAKFNNTSVSSNVSYTYIEAFKEKIGFRQLLLGKVSFDKHHNAKYDVAKTLDYMIDAIILGYSRFSHMDDLKNDEVYKMIKSSELPSESVCRGLLKILPESTSEELRNVNYELLKLKSLNEAPREIMIDFDDTVCTIFGNQEGSAIGYNPRYKGRPSYKEKIGMISLTNELLDITLEDGNHHSNHNFIAFLEEVISRLPSNWVLKRIRLDKGFFDEKLFEYCEKNCIEYVVKAKMYNSLKSVVNYVNNLPAEYPWQKLNSVYSVTEIEVPLPNWSKARRIVIVRKKIKNDSLQLRLFGEEQYIYQAIVTNADNLTAIEVFNDYNQRCNIENKIDELKDGFYFDQNSLINKKANELFLLLKMIAYNLQNWFKSAILPEEFKQTEIPTLRRIFYKVAGNICGSGRYQHIKYMMQEKLQYLIEHVREKLDIFSIQTVVL